MLQPESCLTRLLRDICGSRGSWSQEAGRYVSYYKMDILDDAASKPYKTPVLVLLLNLSKKQSLLPSAGVNRNKRQCSDSKIST